MLLRLIEIVKKYDGTIVTELPVIIDDDGQFAYSGKDSAIRQLIRDVYGTSYIEEKSVFFKYSWLYRKAEYAGA